MRLRVRQSELGSPGEEAAMVVLKAGKISSEHERISPEVLQEFRVRQEDFYKALKEIKRKRKRLKLDRNVTPEE